jgi:hypothetical protein
MSSEPRSITQRNKPEALSPGPECAVLTSIGTVYLYRLGREDMQAWRALPATQLAADKFRVLLRRVASTAIAEQGVREAGGLQEAQVDTLDDEDIERIAEVYLEAPSLRWQQREAAAASPALVRDARESATKFIDRLIHAANGSRSGQWARAAQAAQAAQVAQAALAAQAPPMPAKPRAGREWWIALAAMVLVALLAAVVLAQDYFVVNAMRRDQAALMTQSRQVQGALAAQAKLMNEENALLRRRIEALEAKLRNPPPPAPAPAAPPAAHAVKPKAHPAATRTGTSRPVRR